MRLRSLPVFLAIPLISTAWGAESLSAQEFDAKLKSCAFRYRMSASPSSMHVVDWKCQAEKMRGDQHGLTPGVLASFRKGELKTVRNKTEWVFTAPPIEGFMIFAYGITTFGELENGIIKKLDWEGGAWRIGKAAVVMPTGESREFPRYTPDRSEAAGFYRTYGFPEKSQDVVTKFGDWKRPAPAGE